MGISNSTSLSRATSQPIGGGMGYYGKQPFKAGVGGNSVSGHAGGHAASTSGGTAYQKQLVEEKQYLDKRRNSIEKKANGYRAKVADILLSDHPNTLVNIFKLNYNLRKMERTGQPWNYTATKDVGDLGALQAQRMLIGLKSIRHGVKAYDAENALTKLETELESNSRMDADIEGDELLEANTAMLEAQHVFNNAAPGKDKTDAQNALDRATQRHEAAQMRRDEPGRHATHSNMERATEAGEKLVKELSNMHGKIPEEQKKSRDQLKGLLKLAERANLYTSASQLLTDHANGELNDQVGHLLDIQGLAKGGDGAARAEMYAAFMYGVMAGVDKRHNAANTHTDVAKVFAQLSQGVADSVLAKLAEWKQPVAPVKAGRNAAAQPVRMNDAAGAFRDELAQVAKDQVTMWRNDPQTYFSTFGPSMAKLKDVPVTDWGDAKVDCMFVNGTKGIVDFSTFQGPLNARNITDPANSNSKALRTHMAAQWVKSAIEEMDAYDAANPVPGNNQGFLSTAERAVLRTKADQAMAQVAPIATASSVAAAAARTDALELDRGAQAEFGGHYLVESNPAAFQAVVHTLGALATQDPKDLGSTKFAVVDGTVFGSGFHFDFTTMFHADIAAKNINPTSDEAKQLRNYMAARWIQGMLDHLKTVEILLPGHFNGLNAATRGTIRQLADTAAPRPTAKPTPGVPADWAQRLGNVEANVRTMMDQDVPDVPTPPQTAAGLEAAALSWANELVVAAGVTRDKLGSVPGMDGIDRLIDQLSARLIPATADAALVRAMRADMAATIVKTLMDEFDQRRRRSVSGLLNFNVNPALVAVTDGMMQKLHATTFAPNLQPESAWTFKLADTRQSAKDFMANLDRDSKTDLSKAKQSLESMVTLLNQVADKGMSGPLPTKFGFDKIIDDLVPVETPFDQVEQVGKDLAMVFAQQLIEEIKDRENQINAGTATFEYFGTDAHRSAKLKQEDRDAFASFSANVDRTGHMTSRPAVPVINWAINRQNASIEASAYWHSLKNNSDKSNLAKALGADLERFSTAKHGELFEVLKRRKDFVARIEHRMPSPRPGDKDLLKRMQNDLAAQFLQQLATEIIADTALLPQVLHNRPVDVLTKLEALRADTSLL
jgi:hypothetical protein